MKNLLNKQIYYLANHFANTKLTKNRIQMMLNSQTKPYKKLHVLWAIPICSLIILFNVSYVYAKPEVQEELFVVKKDGKYGIVNDKNELLVSYIYERISINMGEDLIAVKLKYKWGFINKTGKMVIKPQYNKVLGHFSNGAVIVKKGDEYGAIDKVGKVLIPFKYDWMSGFDENGLSITKFKGKEGIINQEHKTIIPFKYLRIDQPNKQGSCLAQNQDSLWGFVNLNNEIKIPFQYEVLEKFDDKGWVKAKQHGKWGFIDAKENIKIPFEYENLKKFQEEGLAYAQKNGKWGVINRQNEIIIPFEYNQEEKEDFWLYFYRFSQNIQNNNIVLVKGDKYGLVDYQNNVILPFEYKWIYQSVETGLIEAQDKQGKKGCFDTKGNLIVPFVCGILRSGKDYILVHDFEVKPNEVLKVALLDLKGNFVIPKEQQQNYSRIFPLTNGLFLVEERGKTGIIDQNGKVVIPSKHDSIMSILK